MNNAVGTHPISRTQVFERADRLRHDIAVGAAVPYKESTKSLNDEFLKTLDRFDGKDVPELRVQAQQTQKSKQRSSVGYMVGGMAGCVAMVGLGVLSGAAAPATVAILAGGLGFLGGLVASGDASDDAHEAATFEKQLDNWESTIASKAQ